MNETQTPQTPNPTSRQATRPVIKIGENWYDVACRLAQHNADLIRVTEALLIDARENIKEIGGCDHIVGICCCGLIHNADEAQAVINAARN